MENLIRHLKINELKGKVVLWELERFTLQNELAWAKTTNNRRAWIRRRMQLQDFEHRAAQNDLSWLQAEERLRRPDRETKISAQA